MSSKNDMAILFPGQGAQYVGMGQELAATYPEAQAIFERAKAALGFPVAKLCFQGPEEELARTSLCQPAILTVSIAALEAWQARTENHPHGPCAGLSLGEYTALVHAGALTFEDAVRVVHQRGQFMEEAARENPGGMLTLLGLEPERVADAVAAANDLGVAEVANYNCPGQIVISGTAAALDWLAGRARDFGARKAARLKVAGAFHSRLMAPAGERLERALQEVAISQPKLPVVSNVTGKFIRSASEIRDLLVRQLTCPVLWEDSMRFLLAQGIRRFVEIGPGKVLSGLLKRIDPTTQTHKINAPADIEQYQQASEPQ